MTTCKKVSTSSSSSSSSSADSSAAEVEFSVVGSWLHSAGAAAMLENNDAIILINSSVSNDDGGNDDEDDGDDDGIGGKPVVLVCPEHELPLLPLREEHLRWHQTTFSLHRPCEHDIRYVRGCYNKGPDGIFANTKMFVIKMPQLSSVEGKYTRMLVANAIKAWLDESDDW